MLNMYYDMMINKYINQIDTSIDALELKLRVWDFINSLDKTDLSEEEIKNIVSNIGNLGTTLDESNPPKFEWYLNTIVDNDLCAKCGACSIVCPNHIVEFEEKPFIVKECLRKGNGMCQEVCPRVNAGSYEIRTRLNSFEEYYYGKSDIKGQSGGVVTKFLEYLLNDKKIDGAVVIGGSHWKPSSMLVTNSQDLLNLHKIDIDSTPKSRYSISSLNAIMEAGEMGFEKIAVVGLPCQVAGLRNIQYHQFNSKHDAERGWNGRPAKIPKIEYVLGLFCTEKFEYSKILDKINTLGINVDDIVKFDVKGPNFLISTETEDHEIKLNEMEPSPGCLMCRDFDAELADISFGEKGSPKGFSTVVIRTEKGKIIKDYFDFNNDVDIEEIEFMRNFKEKRFQKEIKHRKESGKANSYYYLWRFGGVGMGQKGRAYLRFRTTIGGYYDADLLMEISAIAKKYGGIIKLTSREEIEIQGIKLDDVEDIVYDCKDLPLVNGTEGPLIRSLMSCPGKERCLLGLINTSEIAEKIEEKYAEKPANYKFKIGITGCPNKCLSVSTTDFGIHGVKTPLTNDNCNGCGRCEDVCKINAIEITGKNAITDYDSCISCGKCIPACPNNAKDIKYKGYCLSIGGKGGRETILGHEMYVDSEDEIYKTLDAVFEVYNKHAKNPQRERLASTIKRIGQLNFFNEVEKVKLSK
ncbi:MAG: Coenzyme F420 hydrogenase/dehydrogenase, beta subunit C-terminal domain [archaeon]|nr:Coenzyme F420 hydrogenase/dehydrogenase, beta subunit C-terminal domain [archaeon]